MRKWVAAWGPSMSQLWRARAVLGLCIALVAGAVWVAPTTMSAQEDMPVGDLADRAALAGFVDGLMAAHLKQYHIPGAVAVVVADGEVAFAQGYGYADLETLTPVDAETTLFRIGSVTKLFVWTAIMQLVEAGEIALDEDVNTYLAGSGVQVPPTFFAPVTLYHLMSHSPGFEDRNIGLFGRDADSLQPLAALLRELPARVRPPGEVSAYSNYGTALAGLIVEQVTGMAWETYVETHILEPLNMTHTTMRQPVPEVFASDLAQGYRYAAGEQHLEGFEYVPLAPAGSASASGVDMARFMLAHLQGGMLDGGQILEQQTVATMQTQHFAHAPGLPGMAHGFLEYTVGDERWIGHMGDTLWSHTGLYFNPEAGVGIYVAYNGAAGSVAREGVFSAFRARYFPSGEPIVPTPPTNTAQQLAEFAGNYRTTRMPVTTLDKFAGLFTNLTVAARSDGYLQVAGFGLEPLRLTELGPGRFREVDARGTLGEVEVVFRSDPATGRPAALYHSRYPMMAFEQIPWFLGPVAQVVWIVSTLLMAVAVLIAWPQHWWRNRDRPGRKTRVGQWAYGVGTVAALLIVLYIVGLVLVMLNFMEVVYGMPPLLQAITVLTWPIVVLVLGMVVLTGLVWFRQSWRVRGRIVYTLATLMFVVLLLQLWYWNLAL